MSTTTDEITDNTARPLTRDEIEECLTNMAIHAARQPYVVARMLCDPPTNWDKAHRNMDPHLDAWLATR